MLYTRFPRFSALSILPPLADPLLE
ncbi:MAG: hypothetical protein EZS28_052217, partial [Streblomastix strix]